MSTHGFVQSDRIGSPLLPLPEECRAAREILGWSRVDLAKASGRPYRVIADYENGASPNVADIVALARAFATAHIATCSGRIFRADLPPFIPPLSDVAGLAPLMCNFSVRYGERHVRIQLEAVQREE